MLRIATLTVVAMIAFAANSVLARLALATGDAGAADYTGLRLLSGAAMLFIILAWRDRRDGNPIAVKGSWAGAAALFGYAIAFSIAYLMLGAGTGALILFASVQIGILAWAVLRGDRPEALEWLGIAIAFGALVYLVAPGLVAPHPLGALLMLAAGLSWAAYTLLGRGSRSALADTAGNFIRCAPVAVVLVVAGAVAHLPSPLGVAYAVASGAIASGLGYTVWYAALPGLSRSNAAFVQLTVPALAAGGAVIFLDEPLTVRLLVASAGILGGIALALLAGEARKRSASA